MVFDATLMISKNDLNVDFNQLLKSSNIHIIGEQFRDNLESLPLESKILIVLDGVMLETTIQIFDHFKVILKNFIKSTKDMSKKNFVLLNILDKKLLFYCHFYI